MEPLDRRREALVARIEAAFPDPGYPADRRPCPHRCDECDDLSEFFRGKRWHAIAELPELYRLNAAPALLGDDALAYFLPGLMVGCLRDPNGADVTMDFAGYGLLSPTRLGVLESLPPPQRSAVYGYLEWWLEEYDDDAWRQTYGRLVEQIPPDRMFDPPQLPPPTARQPDVE